MADKSDEHQTDQSAEHQTDQSADSDEAEDLIIIENLNHFEKFINNMKNRKSNFSDKARTKLLKVKNQFFELMQEESVFKAEEANKSKIKLSPKSSVSHGAIPKKKTEESDDSIYSSETSDCSDSSREDSKASDKFLRLKTRNHQKWRSYKRSAEIDMRRVAAFKNYDEDSGKDLRKYLKSFEKYCQENVRGSRQSWIDELETRLSGDTLFAFQAVQVLADTYSEARKQLLEWYDDQKVYRKKMNRKNFENAKHTKNESMFLLATRLEKLFRVAFPHKCVDRSSTLQEKFLSIIPHQCGEMMEGKLVSHEMRGTRMSWRNFKKLASCCDNKIRSRKKTEVEEVIINVGMQQQPPLQHDSQQEPMRRQQQKNFGGRSAHENDKAPQRASSALSATPAELSRRNVQCFHCRRFGHVVAQCRSKHRTCFQCGQQGHFVRDCTQNYHTGGHQHTNNSEHVNNAGQQAPRYQRAGYAVHQEPGYQYQQSNNFYQPINHSTQQTQLPSGVMGSTSAQAAQQASPRREQPATSSGGY